MIVVGGGIVAVDGYHKHPPYWYCTRYSTSTVDVYTKDVSVSTFFFTLVQY